MADAIVGDKKEDVGLIPQRAGEPERRNGRLTRNGMLQVVRNGGTFHWTTKHPDGSDAIKAVHAEKDVPTEAEIAQQGGTADEMELARQRNEAEIERLRTENAALKAQQAKPVVKPVTPAAAVTPAK